jgi:chemotaxis receptor (MCP) glutamine deamidase CheD
VSFRFRPARGWNESLSPSGRRAHSRRFGDLATQDLLRSFLDSGSRAPHLVARVIGGAHINAPDAPDSLGRRNAAAAIRVLDRQSVRIESQDVGGPAARRLKFHTATGVLETRRIDPLPLPVPAPAEAFARSGSA